MTRLKQLATSSPEVDEIRNLEAEVDPIKVTIVLTPLIQFIIEALVANRLHLSRTRAVTRVTEAAALDLLENAGFTTESPEFRQKYRAWLTRKPQMIEDFDGEEIEVFEVITL